MRFDPSHKAQTRNKILKAAAAAVREQGVEKVGVAQVMAEAGLTTGGFYAHFENKDDLIAHAINFAFDERYSTRLEKLNAMAPEAALAQFIDYYLSVRQLEDVAHGCPIPALVSDVSRATESIKADFTRGIDRLVTWLAIPIERVGSATPYDDAMSVVAELVGAMSIARTIENKERAETLLSASRQALKSRLRLAPAERPNA